MTIKLTDPWAPTSQTVCDFGHYSTGPYPPTEYVVNGIAYPPQDWTWTVNGVTYSSEYAALTAPFGQPIIFDAIDSLSLGLPKVITPPNVEILSYTWDLGNGQTGYGPVVSATYEVDSPDLSITLTVVDSLDRVTSTTHLLPLTQFILWTQFTNTWSTYTAQTWYELTVAP